MLRASRRPADGRNHRLRSAGVVSRLCVLQAPPHTEEALAGGLPVLGTRLPSLSFGGHGGNGITQRNSEAETKRRIPIDFSVQPPFLRFSVLYRFLRLLRYLLPPLPFPAASPGGRYVN